MKLKEICFGNFWMLFSIKFQNNFGFDIDFKTKDNINYFKLKISMLNRKLFWIFKDNDINYSLNWKYEFEN